VLPGIPPFSGLSLLLTLGGFVGGAVLWQVVASHSGVWGRMRYQEGDITRLLTRQLSIVVGLTAVMILLGALFGEPVASLFRWMSTIGGVIFWAYLGALALTALRGATMKR
jgi:hypothetical protein